MLLMMGIMKFIWTMKKKNLGIKSYHGLLKLKIWEKLINVILNVILAFPIDIIIGSPRPVLNKLRTSVLIKFILFILYFYIAYK